MNTAIDWSLVLGLLLALPAPTWPFSLSSQRPNPPVYARMIRKGSGIDEHSQLDSRVMNTNNDWSRSSSSRNQQQQLGVDTDFLEAEVVAHQSVLNSITTQQQHLNDHHNINHLVLLTPTKSESKETLDINPSIIAPPSSTTTTTATSSFFPFILNDTWKARLLLHLSAALYGTNFTMVKNLDDIMPVGISSTMRFGFAALVMLPMLIAPLSDELEVSTDERRRMKTTRESGETRCSSSSGRIDDDRIENIMFPFLQEPSRLSAGLAGMEIGLYNSIGYITQAVGLRTTTASKVRCVSLDCST